MAPYLEAGYPVRNQSDWKTSEDYVDMTVLPQEVVKRIGRPKKKRILSISEAPKLHKCGRCKKKPQQINVYQSNFIYREVEHTRLVIKSDPTTRGEFFL